MTQNLAETTPRRRGRPRAFDRSAALETAMLLFWRQGYEGTSIAQLSESIGINAPSLYAAYGSKENLYRESLQLYLGGMGDIGVASLEDAPSAREGVLRVLKEAARAFTRPGYPAGCMVGVGSLRTGEESRIASEETTRLRKRSQSALLARFKRARKEGEIGAGVDLAALTDFYSSVVEGMSVQAQDGASRARLMAIGELAMKTWPA
jgi:AcrR family transcriptional regulator